MTSHGEKVLHTPRQGNETEAREAAREDPGEAGIRKRKRQGAEEGSRWLLNSPSFLKVDAEDFFVLPFVSQARKRNILS